MAAVLACGDGAVLSHASAAALWGFLRAEAEGPVDVSVPSPSGQRRRSGIRVHRTTLPPARPHPPRRDPRHHPAPHDLRHPPHPRARARPPRRPPGPAPRLPRHPPQGRPHPQRPRARLPRLLPPPPPAARPRSTSASATPDRLLHRRLPLARPPPRGRNRQLRVPPRATSPSRTTTRATWRCGGSASSVLRYTGRQLEREGAPIAAEIRARLAAEAELGGDAGSRSWR